MTINMDQNVQTISMYQVMYQIKNTIEKISPCIIDINRFKDIVSTLINNDDKIIADEIIEELKRNQVIKVNGPLVII